MSRTQSSDIQLKDNENNTSPGTLVSTLYEPGDRLSRAGIRLAAFWAAALVAVFIPLAHFVLVPAFLIAGIVMAISAYRTDQSLNEATGDCPVCHESVSIPLEANDQLPKWTYCPHCNASLQIQRLESTASE
ncbi:hypothetical protein [Kaarinaea lacus]